MQRMGAFKFRSAYNALSKFDAEQRRRGVVAFSSGNLRRRSRYPRVCSTCRPRS
ncbi:MAG: L-threo-3-hydroxyaspartate ammonia-lyase (EC [uncultured Paraburkholderia sp.]|nr:MAG: L-threo-3-hydroxyaspartate ammonia-lyase (EC [uncultured Paraburkholderia sp.]CAH2938438.1 MAG: L-threo-3-hydroxyaspartate ammonia-lyase (EC [uncultured Paraburkholderia sp.]